MTTRGNKPLTAADFTLATEADLLPTQAELTAADFPMATEADLLPPSAGLTAADFILATEADLLPAEAAEPTPLHETLAYEQIQQKDRISTPVKTTKYSADYSEYKDRPADLFQHLVETTKEKAQVEAEDEALGQQINLKQGDQWPDPKSHEELMAEQVQSKDRISPTPPVDTSPLPEPVDPGKLKPEIAVQQLIKEDQQREHGNAAGYQTMLKQGEQWPEPPEPKATHPPIEDSPTSVNEKNQQLKDELTATADDLRADENTVGILPPEPTIENWQPMNSYTFQRQNGEVFDVSVGSSWKFKTKSGNEITGDDDGYQEFIVEKIERSSDGSKLKIAFTGQEPVARETSEWAEIFAAGSPNNQNETLPSGRAAEKEVSKYESRKEKPPKLAEVVDHYAAKPGEAMGVTYENGQVVPERTNIPKVEVVEPEVVDHQEEATAAGVGDIHEVETAEKAVEAAAEVDEQREEGKPQAGDVVAEADLPPGRVPTYHELSQDPDQTNCSADAAAGAEARAFPEEASSAEA